MNGSVVFSLLSMDMNSAGPLSKNSITLIISYNRTIKHNIYIANMVKLHMRPNALPAMGSGNKAYMKLLDEAVEPADLLLLAKADHLGCGGERDYSRIEQLLQSKLEAYRELMQQPQVRGEDLIQAGVKPGKQMGDAIAYAHRLHLSGIDHQTALVQTLAWLKDVQTRH